MKPLLTIILLAFSSAAMALLCTALPKPDLEVDEIEISVTEGVNGEEIITTAWPTTDPTLVCCNFSENDCSSWVAIFRRLRTPGNTSRSLKEFANAIGSTPGERVLSQLPESQARCDVMADKILLPSRPKVVRNAQRADGSRPMFTLNAAGSMVNLRVNGVQVYVEAGRICRERAPVTSTSTTGRWHYATNSAGVRGITLCK